MHSYLNAIGMGSYDTKDKVLRMLEQQCRLPHGESHLEENGMKYVEISALLGDGLGMKFIGIDRGEGVLELEYYYPYAIGKETPIPEEVFLEKMLDGDCYKGVCDDVRIGASLIFHVQNSFEMWKKKTEGAKLPKNMLCNFVGLANEGKILLPVAQSEMAMKRTKVEANNRNKLISAAKQGDENAMESLTMEELDIYSKISERIRKEDLFTIVNSSFIPYGIQCDRYTVIGTILDFYIVKNIVTDEEIYHMTVECNDVPMHIVINKKELFGEPQIGRRFKGVVWLQGKVQQA